LLSVFEVKRDTTSDDVQTCPLVFIGTWMSRL
jgi:hypothetical protein